MSEKNNDFNENEVEDLDEEMYVTLTFDDGDEVECAILTIFPVDEKDYIALLPLDEDGENTDGDVYLYRYSEDADGNPELENIENDDEYEAVGKAFDLFLKESEENESEENESEENEPEE